MVARPDQPLVSPRLAEMVARQLRDEILAGRYAELELLPRQQELISRFGISPPPVREALRILETEGLISVQRGREGGAVVHRPRLSKVTYMLGMVLQADAVPIEDAIGAYGLLEPAVAAECARRADRATTIVPLLRDNVEQSQAALDDGAEYRRLANEFHHLLASHSANSTVTALMEVLRTLAVSQIQHLNAEINYLGAFEDADVRRVSLAEHEELLARIDGGDATGAYALAREHMSEAHWPTPVAAAPPIVDVSLI